MAPPPRATANRLLEAFRRIVRAYALAYVSSTGPRVLRILIALHRKDLTASDATAALCRTLQHALQTDRFPAFCGAIVGLSTLLPQPFRTLLEALYTKPSGEKRNLVTNRIRLLSTFLATLVAAAVGFQLLNRSSQATPTVQTSSGEPVISVTESEPAVRDVATRHRPSRIPDGLPSLPPEALPRMAEVSASGIPLAGRTMDLTLFALVRALDVLLQSRATAGKPARSRSSAIAWRNATSIVFALSSATIMYAFFYKPTRLPYTYVKWIERISELDERLLHVLRQAYYGNFVYGKDTGIAPLLGSMAVDCGLPEVWGDPAKTIPVPCELVHHGKTKSCELYAAWRLWRGFACAAGVYLPLSAIVLIRKLQMRRAGQSQADIVRAVLVGGARSSAFLGAFIAFFYYGVCLTRTRIGPRLLHTNAVFDYGLGICGGCAVCGWSVLLEDARRRVELTLFVLPRALAVVTPRRYPKQYLWREHIVFTLSAATVLTAIKERPETVRGVFGRILRSVLT